MEMVNISTQMAINTSDLLKMEKFKEKVYFIGQMVLPMKEISKEENLKVKVF